MSVVWKAPFIFAQDFWTIMRVFRKYTYEYKIACSTKTSVLKESF